jgi:hypothetical protein
MIHEPAKRCQKITKLNFLQHVKLKSLKIGVQYVNKIKWVLGYQKVWNALEYFYSTRPVGRLLLLRTVEHLFLFIFCFGERDETHVGVLKSMEGETIKKIIDLELAEDDL